MVLEVSLAIARTSLFFAVARVVVPAAIRALGRTNRSRSAKWQVMLREIDAEDAEKIRNVVAQRANYCCALKATYLSVVSSCPFVGFVLFCGCLDLVLPWLSALALLMPVAFALVSARCYLAIKVRPFFDRLVRETRRCQGLKACVDADMVAFVLYKSVLGLRRGSDYVEVRFIYVQKDFRGSGIASGLLRQLKSQQQRTIKARLHDFTATSAQQLFEHCGFKRSNATWDYAHLCYVNNRVLIYTFLSATLSEVVTK